MQADGGRPASRRRPRLRIGVIADTHALLRPEAVAALDGSDLILHAGDIGSEQVLEGLQALAPVFAIRGNVDRAGWARRFPQQRDVQVGGLIIHLLHDIKSLAAQPEPAAMAAIVCGHSHRAHIGQRNGVLVFNPGSAGPRRFRLPVSLGVLELNARSLTPRIIDLAV